MLQHSLSNLFTPLTIHKATGSELSYYQQPIEQLDVPGFSPFFCLHLAIWQLRPFDLQRQFPLNTERGRQEFFAWCVVHGRNEYAALRELQVFWKALAQPAVIPLTPYSGAITRLMQLAVMSRLDLQIDFTLATEEQQFKLLQWFCFHGWKELGLRRDDIADCQKPYFNKNPPNNISFFDAVIYASRLELQNRFNLFTVSGRAGYSQWIEEVGVQDTLLNLLSLQPNDPLPEENKLELIFGVNLIGYAYGELGIGEDVRMAALALEAANIPFTVINFRPGNDIRQNDQSIAQWVTNEPIYQINIVCLTALEHLRLYVEQGEALFMGRYTIGYWPWELQNWPVNWQHCFSLVDEVWVSSQHTWQTAHKVSSVPVHLMPMAVAIPKVKRYTRKQWSLPDTDYLFVFSFDGNSSLARKNPLGVIDAFKLAFPNDTESVGLVIKCMRPDTNNPVWQHILKLAASDSRVHIVDQMLSKPEVLGLYKVCDCFVSLHRAEGFGRGIAEALLLGLNVIATNYGGNVDFCLPISSRLVSYKLVKVREKDYVEVAGQFWAEPELVSAASIMQDIAGKGRKSKKTINSDIKKQFALKKIGENYKYRLIDIMDSI